MADRPSVAELIRARREARQQAAQPTRQARTLDDANGKAEESPETPPEPTLHRRERVEPVPLPENVTPIEPTKPRRPIITEAELNAKQQIPTLEQVAETIKLPTPPRMDRVKEQAQTASQALIIGLLEHMRAGEQLLLTRANEGLWSIVIPTSVVGNYVVTAVAPTSEPPKVQRQVVGKLPKGFHDALLNPAYVAWKETWRAKTVEERIAEAESVGANIPDKSQDPLVFNMQLSMAVQAKTGVPKYKPEYSTQAARKDAEAKAKQGLPY